MFSFRGDAHRLYIKLRKRTAAGIPPQYVKELEEIREIRTFYKQLSTSSLKDIKYRMTKEKSGSGMIPLLVTAGPWALFIFGKQVQDLFTQGESKLWMWFIFFYLTAVVIGVIIHFREQSWGSVHITIIEDILDMRDAEDD